jgi:hypothetical protein
VVVVQGDRRQSAVVDPDPIVEDKCQGLTLQKMAYQKGLCFLLFTPPLYSTLFHDILTNRF